MRPVTSAVSRQNENVFPSDVTVIWLVVASVMTPRSTCSLPTVSMSPVSDDEDGEDDADELSGFEEELSSDNAADDEEPACDALSDEDDTGFWSTVGPSFGVPMGTGS